MYGFEAFWKGLEWIIKATCNTALLERSGHTTVWAAENEASTAEEFAFKRTGMNFLLRAKISFCMWESRCERTVCWLNVKGHSLAGTKNQPVGLKPSNLGKDCLEQRGCR